MRAKELLVPHYWWAKGPSTKATFISNLHWQLSESTDSFRLWWARHSPLCDQFSRADSSIAEAPPLSVWTETHRQAAASERTGSQWISRYSVCIYLKGNEQLACGNFLSTCTPAIFLLEKKIKCICPINRNLPKIPSPTSFYKYYISFPFEKKRKSKFMQRKETWLNKFLWTSFLSFEKENNISLATSTFQRHSEKLLSYSEWSIRMFWGRFYDSFTYDLWLKVNAVV